MILEQAASPMIVVTMVLLAALVVAPAAARTDIDTLEPGGTVYVGEENLNFGPAFGPEPVTRLVHFSDPSSGLVDRIITVSPQFELTRSVVGTTTGTYYAFNQNAEEMCPANAAGYILISIPNVALDVVLNASRIDSVDGKSVTRDNILDFKVQDNLAGFAGVAGAPAMNIEVTLPGGGVTTQFGGQDLRGIPADGTTVYLGGIDLRDAAAGTHTAVAKWPAASDFYGKGFDSRAVTFEVVTRNLGISSNKDTVIRGNSFVVTTTGEAKKDYRLFVKDVIGLTAGEYPVVAPGQLGIRNYSPTDVTITTTAGGTRSIQFNTNQSTGDWRFTIRVEDPVNPSACSEVMVRVERGDVTVTSSGTGVYYIGDEITISGTNTDSDTVYLFLTGPNLNTNGARLSDVAVPVEDGNPVTFTCVAVEADDTWSYRWSTADGERLLDAGGYTIYAVAEPRGKGSLSGVQYATTSIQLRSPSVTATTSGVNVAKGDDLTISGTATGNPDGVLIWIFGKNYYKLQQPVLVESDGSFEYRIESADTRNLMSGKYFVVVQHPMANGAEVWVSGTTLTGNGVTPVDLASLQAFDAATALITALDSPNVDDIYARLTFNIEEPHIGIDPIGNQTAGIFTITGTTNLAVGDILNIEVTSAAFQPTTKTGPTDFNSTSGAVTVQKGDSANTWSFEVDVTGFRPDRYNVRVESIEIDVFQTTAFNIIEGPGASPSGEGITLHPGWNFISVPRPLATGNDTAAIFAAVETGGRSVFRYNTAAGEWVALAATDQIAPLEGFWIYSTGPATVPLNFSTDPLIPPAERTLSPGWNAIGITGTAPAAARDALLSVNGQWTTLIGFDAGKQAFETGIISSGSKDYADSRLVYQGKGYWLYMTGPGTLCAVGA